MLKLNKIKIGVALFIVSSMMGPISWSQSEPESIQRQPLEVGSRNLSDAGEASRFADELVTKFASGSDLIVYHVGEQLPDQLKEVLFRLRQKHINTKIILTNEKELENSLDQINTKPQVYQELLSYDYQGGVRGNWALLKEKSKSFLKNTYGVPDFKALTLWVSVPRTTRVKKIDSNRALISSVIASVSIGAAFVSTYYDKGLPIDPSIILPTLSLGAWVYLNMYNFRSIHEVMSQGRSYQRIGNTMKSVPNSVFFWHTNFLRSFITNAIVQVTKSGPFEFFNSANLHQNALNSLITIFSRSEIDKWIASNTPTSRDVNNEIIILPGQWSEKRAATINLIWNSSHGFIKSLHLLGFEHQVMNVVYGGLAVFNLGMLVKNNSNEIKNNISALFDKITGKANAAAIQCSTLMRSVPL